MSARPVAHGPLASLALAAFALALTPVAVASLIIAFAQLRIAELLRWQRLEGREFRLQSKRHHAHHRPTALVNGGRMQKAVYVVRALARQGYRVVLVEERGWGELCAARFSNAVDRFRFVPGAGGQKYIDALVAIANEERIDLFVPCSGAGTTLEDAIAAQQMRQAGEKRSELVTVIQDPELAETLHEKDRFISLVHELGLEAPVSHVIRTPDEAMTLLREHTDKNSPVLLKAATVLDDVGRSDMTTYPLRDQHTDKPNWEATRRRLVSGLFVPLSPSSPYIAQEFIGGPGASEWCTHATVHNGRITAFVCCPSNDMLMTYHNATHTCIGQRALRWTETFLARLQQNARWKGTRLTGQFSFDFIHQPAKDRLVVIECNPRVHTAVCLLDRGVHTRDAFGAALAGDEKRVRRLPAPLMPTLDVDPVSWHGHDLFARMLPHWLPRALAVWLYGARSRTQPSPSSNRSKVAPAPVTKNAPRLAYDLDEVGRDGAWSPDDPHVYAVLYHLQWPQLLLRQALVRRKPFSRINASTARIFEC